MADSSLKVGATYFRLTFADRDLTMPGLKPLVFLGEVDEPGGGKSLAFQDSVSFVRFGSAFTATEGFDEIEGYFLQHDEIGSSVLTVNEAASQVTLAAERADTLGHPVLQVLRDGWR